MKKLFAIFALLFAASAFALDGVPVPAVQWYINPATGQLVGYRNTVTNQDDTAISGGSISGGTIAGVTSFGIRSSGTGAYDLQIVNTENLTANRALTIKLNNTARTVDLGGNVTTAGAFSTAGAFATTLTATGATNVTLPTTGTLAILGANIFTGAQTAPAFIPDSATVPTNGMFLSAANVLGFATNNIERWDINASGAFNPTTDATNDIGTALVRPRDITASRTITGATLVATASSTPASNAACDAGTIYWDASYIYVCTATGVVKRAALTGGY